MEKRTEDTIAYKLGRAMGTVLMTVFFGCLAAVLITLTYKLCGYILFH